MNVTYFGQQKTLKRLDKLIAKNTFKNIEKFDNSLIKINVESHNKSEFRVIQSMFTGDIAATIDKARGIGGKISVLYQQNNRKLEVTVFSDSKKQPPMARITAYAIERAPQAS